MRLMRKLCPNLDLEDGLDTVLEVPIPEETYDSGCSSKRSIGKSVCSSIVSWVRTHTADGQRCLQPPSSIGRGNELQLMLGVIGAPLVPVPVRSQHASISHAIKDEPIEASMAKYIVQQYIAAVGGEKALNSISSMCATGKVRMTTLELRMENDHGGSSNYKKAMGKGGDHGEMGGFVLWQKKPDLWCLELVVSGWKLGAGSDGKVAWRQTPWQQSHTSRGPPRPLRRILQGLDPRSTANLFPTAVCIGEKSIDGEDCFVLRVEAEQGILRARSSSSIEIIRHTVWGYFSQRTGLLVGLDDSHLLRMQGPAHDDATSVYWETTMESLLQDYRRVDGVNVAHGGRTAVSLFRFGETAGGHTRTRMEETWTVEEVDFNIRGLSMDCFLPPGDLKEEKDVSDRMVTKKGHRPIKMKAAAAAAAAAAAPPRLGSAKVAAVDTEGSDTTEEGRHEEL